MLYFTLVLYFITQVRLSLGVTEQTKLSLNYYIVTLHTIIFYNSDMPGEASPKRSRFPMSTRCVSIDQYHINSFLHDLHSTIQTSRGWSRFCNRIPDYELNWQHLTRCAHYSLFPPRSWILNLGSIGRRPARWGCVYLGRCQNRSLFLNQENSLHFFELQMPATNHRVV